MASQQKSTVGDVINFQASEDVKWRKGDENVSDMIEQILEYRNIWESKQETIATAALDEIKRQFNNKFIFHCGNEEWHGVKSEAETASLLLGTERTKLTTIEQQETSNLDKAYTELLKSVQDEDSENYGFIESSLLKQLNKTILGNVPLPLYATKPGCFSENPRCTSFQGETYYYQQPDDMECAVNVILDRFNDLYNNEVKTETDKKKQLEKHFKLCSWLVYEMLDLHPFGDGNGRMSRLLSSYVLSVFTPVPTPIYNFRSNSLNQDYLEALIAARRRADRHPCTLTTMIIECNWYTWKNFHDRIEEVLHNTTTTTTPTTLVRGVEPVLPWCRPMPLPNIYKLLLPGSTFGSECPYGESLLTYCVKPMLNTPGHSVVFAVIITNVLSSGSHSPHSYTVSAVCYTLHENDITLIDGNISFFKESKNDRLLCSTREHPNEIDLCKFVPYPEPKKADYKTWVRCESHTLPALWSRLSGLG